LTESRKPTASPAIADDSSITIGVIENRNQGAHGAVVRATVAALSHAGNRCRTRVAAQGCSDAPVFRNDA
jgi:hypothetical protein